jgi:hypothetical protein
MNRATGATSLSVAAVPHKRRHHRHKRFRRPRESLGLNYERFDIEPPGVPETAPTSLDPQPGKDPETKKYISRRGMRHCAWILLVVFLAYHYKWVWHLYLTAMRSWPDLHWH